MMQNVFIYLDNNATTRPLPDIVERLADICGGFANPSSQHAAGGRVRRQVEAARQQVAGLIGSSAFELFFTSGGTESIATVMHAPWDVIIISAVEHAAVLDAASAAEKRGTRVVRIGVNRDGALDEVALWAALEEASGGKVLVSLMLANNETGVVFPLECLGPQIKRHGAFFHVDAVQCIGKMPVDVQLLHCDFLSISAHKFHGLKGCGALYLRNGVDAVPPLIHGHHEGGMRGGTENVLGIISMGEAAEAALRGLDGVGRIEELRNVFEACILQTMPECRIHGRDAERLCNTSNIHFPGKDGAALVEALSGAGVMASAGAACTTGGAPSHVLQAMGASRKEANESLRFSLGQETTREEVLKAAEVVVATAQGMMTVYQVN